MPKLSNGLRIGLTLGAGVGLFAGFCSLLLWNKYIENNLFHLAFFQFLEIFNVVTISCILLSLAFAPILKIINHFRFNFRQLLILAGLILAFVLYVMHAKLYSIPKNEIAKFIELPVMLLLITISVITFLIVSKSIANYALPLTWKVIRMSCLIIIAMNFAGIALQHSLQQNANRKPNIVMISIDTIRPDHFGCYGYARNTTPEIGRFAEEAVRFENVVVPMSHTLPSHVSLFTGLYPKSHGVKMNGVNFDSNFPTVTEILKNQGFKTAAFVGSVILDSHRGLSHGFDLYDDDMKGQSWRRAKDVRRAAEKWIKENHKSRFFVFAHFWDAHAPYSPPAPFDTLFHRLDLNSELNSIYRGTGSNHLHLKLQYPDYEKKDLFKLVHKQQNLYDGEVRYIDQNIGKLLNLLKSLGLWDETLVVITGDHGESLGERGYWGHDLLFDEQILVPLLVKVPGYPRARESVNETVRTIDICPTILDLLHIDHHLSFDGKSFVEIFRTKKRLKSRPAFIERRDYPARMRQRSPEECGKGDEYALRTTQWKFIMKTMAEDELYNLIADPYEQENIIKLKPKVARNLREKLRLWLEDVPDERTPIETRLDPDSIEPLRSLGYIR